MSRLRISDIETAVVIYYRSPELSTSDIMTLFNCSKSAVRTLKQKARETQKEQGKHTFSNSTVNTKCAYQAWNIDIDDLEKRLIKLHKIQNIIGG